MANPFEPIAILRPLLTPMIAMGLLSGPASGQSQDSGNAPPPYQAGQMAQPVRDPVIAIVDGRELHLSELGDLIQDLPVGERTLPFDTLYPALLSDLIDQNALELKARRLRLDQDPAVIRKMRAAAGRVLGQVLLNQIQHDEVTEPRSAGCTPTSTATRRLSTRRISG
jgi:peptidyl-prolyl cis-trans isomerase C